MRIYEVCITLSFDWGTLCTCGDLSCEDPPAPNVYTTYICHTPVCHNDASFVLHCEQSPAHNTAPLVAIHTYTLTCDI